MGLKNHVIEDENSTMNYDGTQYPSADWNGHLTLQQAFGTLLYLVFPAGDRCG